MTKKQVEFGRALLDKSIGTLLKRTNGGQPVKSIPQLNNVLMQLRKNCNHPNLITAQLERHTEYPSSEEMIEQCGKFRLLDRLLTSLKARGHKVRRGGETNEQTYKREKRTEETKAPPRPLTPTGAWLGLLGFTLCGAYLRALLCLRPAGARRMTLMLDLIAVHLENK
eukprot:6237116-Pyramimonas_sp.AAC.1